MQRAMWLLATMLALSAGAATAAEPQLRHYPVDGQSLQQLLESLEANGPVDENGNRFHAYTRWQVSWQYRTVSRGRRCRISSIDARASCTITLPQWRDASLASASLQQRWQRYSQALREHEDGHYQFAREVAGQVRKALQDLSSDQGCDALAQQANAVAESIQQDYRQREIDYDRDTGHSRERGVML